MDFRPARAICAHRSLPPAFACGKSHFPRQREEKNRQPADSRGCPYDLRKADTGRQSERSQRTTCAICCAAARTAFGVPGGSGGLYDLLDADSGRQNERLQFTACAICCAAARTAFGVPGGTAIHRALARDRLSLRFAQRRFRVETFNFKSHYLRDSLRVGTRRSGF